MKIAIIGYSGSGKSTLARKLGITIIAMYYTLIVFTSPQIGKRENMMT